MPGEDFVPTEDDELFFEHRNAKGDLHREDGPAMDFGDNDPRNRYFLDGREVGRKDLDAYALAKAQAEKMEKAWQADQVRQLSEGASRPVPVRKALKLKKPG